jgi:1-aminocyclopropane-1-carboxylate deaminase/D-cysteine desulfhydrase-like pyridoxal-dependent ACC family enzyme
MKLHFVSRKTYRSKYDFTFLQNLKDQFGEFYMIPEGCTNSLAIKGVKEFGESLLQIPCNYLCCPVGTGGTLTGLIKAFGGQRMIIGFPVLKGGEFLSRDIQNNLTLSTPEVKNWKLKTDYHFGGYGRVSKELMDFISEFEARHGILLDPIYTGKMMAGIFDMIGKQKFPRGSVILAIHTGGLQGWEGIRQRFGEKFN